MRVLTVCCLLMTVQAARAEVVVRVVDPAGSIVPGARVVLLNASGTVLARGETSAEGEAPFAEQADSVEVTAKGFRSATVEVRDRSSILVFLELLPVRTAVEVADKPPEMLAPVAVDTVEPDYLSRPDLVESLRAAPQVHVLRRGGINFEPVVQGLRETQLLMVVDGTRTFAAGPARMDSELSHVDPGNVSSVEVVTGPYALTEGAGAMGAILVRSDEIPRQKGWRLAGRAGLGWRGNGAGRLGQSRVDAGNSAFGFSLHGTGDLLDDYSAGASGKPTTVLIPGDASAHQLGAKVRLNPADEHEILLSGFYDEQTGVDYPGRLLTAEHFLLRAWRASYRLAKPDRLVSVLKFNAYVNKKSHRMSNREKPTARDMPGRRPPFALDVSLPTESDTVGGSGRVELSSDESWRVQAGFDMFRLEQDAQRFIARASDRKLLFSDIVWAGASLGITGVYVQAGHSFERGEIQTVLRFDFVNSDAGRPSPFFLQHSGTALRRSETNANFSVAGRYELGAGLTLAGGVGRVVRTANALERYSDRFPSTRFQVAAEFMGTPGIRPEASLQGDLNLEWKVGKFRVHAGGYARNLDDYITVQPDSTVPKRLPLSPPVVFRYVNGKAAFFRGWTVGVRRSMDTVEVRVQASKTLADDRQLLEPVLGIAPMEVDSAVRILSPSRRFWVEYGMRNVWDQRRTAVARMETPSPGFSLHAVRFGADLWKGTTVHLGVENVGDKYYYEHLNSVNPFTSQRIPEMGRSFMVALSTRW